MRYLKPTHLFKHLRHIFIACIYLLLSNQVQAQLLKKLINKATDVANTAISNIDTSKKARSAAAANTGPVNYSKDNNPVQAPIDYSKTNHPVQAPVDYSKDNHQVQAPVDYSKTNHPVQAPVDYSKDNHPVQAPVDYSKTNHQVQAPVDYSKDNHSVQTPVDHSKDQPSASSTAGDAKVVVNNAAVPNDAVKESVPVVNKKDMTSLFNGIVNQAADHWWLSKYVQSSIHDVKVVQTAVNGTPEKVTAKYFYVAKSGYGDQKVGSMEVLMTNGLAYYVSYEDSFGSYEEPKPVPGKLEDLYTADEIANINKARVAYDQKNIRDEQKKTRDTYAAALKQQAVAAKGTSSAGCLIEAPYLYRERDDITYTETGAVGKNSDGDIDYGPVKKTMVNYKTSKDRGLKNKCSHTVIIKGMYKDQNTDKSKTYYSDISIKLAPGEVIKYIKIEPTYDPAKAEGDSRHYYK